MSYKSYDKSSNADVNLLTKMANRLNININKETSEDRDSFTIDGLKSETHSQSNPLAQSGSGLFSQDNSLINMVLASYADSRPDVAIYILNNSQCTDINTVDKYGRNLLHYLAMYSVKHEESFRYLSRLLLKYTDCSSSVNKQDLKGNTPAHYAAMVGNDGLVEAFKLKSADLSVKNLDGYYIGVQTEQESDVIVVIPKETNSYVEMDPRDRDIFVKNAQPMTEINADKIEGDMLQLFLKSPKKENRTVDSLTLPSRDDTVAETQNTNKGNESESVNIDTDAFIKTVLEKFKKNGESNDQAGGSKGYVGTRKLNTYSEFTVHPNVSSDMVGGRRDDDSSAISEMARAIQNQGEEVHKRVVEKIAKLLNIEIDKAKIYKAGLYDMVKKKRPELNNYDRAVEMEKMVTEDILNTIDIDKLSKLIEEKRKAKQLSTTSVDTTSQSDSDSNSDSSSEEKKPKKKATKKATKAKSKSKASRVKSSPPSVSTEHSSEFSLTSPI
uniref:Uncharacterized protein n=1 Tax=viral metagenome TaxID=1070528 RepID=A0A6C0EAU2_9ZZZZ